MNGISQQKIEKVIGTRKIDIFLKDKIIEDLSRATMFLISGLFKKNILLKGFLKKFENFNCFIYKDEELLTSIHKTKDTYNSFIIFKV